MMELLDSTAVELLKQAGIRHWADRNGSGDGKYNLSFSVDGSKGCPVLSVAVCQAENGTGENPLEIIAVQPINYLIGFMPFHAREIAGKMSLEPPTAYRLEIMLQRLYHLFVQYDLERLEVNPLIITGGEAVAARVKMFVDDDAIHRQRDLLYLDQRSPGEKKAHELGFAYVDLGGNVGIMANGAGINMATLDIIQDFGGKAGNFLDTGGGPNEELLTQALELLLEKNPKVIFINIFGGITRCDDVALAIAAIKKRKVISVPMVIRMVGTCQEQGRKILEDVGIKAYDHMHEAAKIVVQIAQSQDLEG